MLDDCLHGSNADGRGRSNCCQTDKPNSFLFGNGLQIFKSIFANLIHTYIARLGNKHPNLFPIPQAIPAHALPTFISSSFSSS